MITIIGLGIKSGELTLNARAKLRSGLPLLLRTARHPVAEALSAEGIPFRAFDALYEQSEDFSSLNAAIAQAVLQSAPCVFAAPGGAGLFDEGVRAVVSAARKEGVAIEILPGVGLAESAAAQNGGAFGALTLAAADFGPRFANPRLPLILVELGSRVLAAELKLKLLEHYPAGFRVSLCGEEIPLEELDRQPEGVYGHLCALFVPALPLLQASRFDLHHLDEIVTRLRAPDGCPWDKEQTHESLTRDLIEESYEALDAIQLADMPALCDELGDVLLQIALHAQIAKEHGDFALADVTSALCEKLIRRHPHVFGDVQAASVGEVLANWDEIKKAEKGFASEVAPLRDVPSSFPALLRAEKVQKRARKLGFDFHDFDEALQKLLEEIDECRAASTEERGRELGDLLFSAVNLCRFASLSPEIALNATTERFIARMGRMEAMALAKKTALSGMTMPELDILWAEAKALEGKGD
ncbi:MAG: nucleoside triphosphate pyrophosphohydrolase [Christensenellaceae bacterium]|jgi:tetrapyrrole methylase family protein/MazG family protein|nr:nucleoside triphosphate pyrophosphohydrolase [Christensenellaceae bacterium]